MLISLFFNPPKISDLSNGWKLHLQYGLLFSSHLFTDFYNQNFGGKIKKAGSLAVIALGVL